MSRILLACVGVLLSLQLSSSQPQHVDYWQLNFDRSPPQHAYSASFYGVSEASHFIAERYWQQQRRSRALAYYQRAVDQGDAGAAYSLAQRIPAQREQWLRAAAELGDPRASMTIAKQLRASDPELAITLVQALPGSDERNAMLASLLFNYEAGHADLQWQNIAPPTPAWQQRIELAQSLNEQHGYAPGNAPGNGPGNAACSVTLILHYHASEARDAAYDWLSSMAQHPFAKLGLCFVEADFAATNAYQCEQDAVGRAQCLAQDTAPMDFAIHVVDEGTANVRANHMSIAQTASFDIFIHELAHLFALADEYPMRDTLAQAFCSGRYRFSPLNLVITPKASTQVSLQQLATLRDALPWAAYLQQPIAVPVLVENRAENGAGQGDQYQAPYYQLGSPSTEGVGLFKADTCEGTDYQAWRPVAAVTFMQQHEVGSVPAVYIEMMRAYLQGQQKQQR